MALTDQDNIFSYDYSHDYGANETENQGASNFSDYQYSGDYYDYSGDYASDLRGVKHTFNYSGLAVTELESQPPRWDPTTNFLDLVALKIYMFVPSIAAMQRNNGQCTVRA